LTPEKLQVLDDLCDIFDLTNMFYERMWTIISRCYIIFVLRHLILILESVWYWHLLKVIHQIV
jgi:hypothetical protein